MSWVQSIDTVYSRIFAGAFALVVLWESFRPFRPLRHPTLRRWCSNALLFAAGKAFTFALSGLAIGIAVAVSHNPFGLLNRPALPYWLRFALALLLLDLLAYGRHCLLHANGFLWRFHQIHHSDEDYDLTTGFRFHPGEDLLIEATDLIAIAILAPPPLAVAALAAINVSLNFFNHGNMVVPTWLERALRPFLISPGIHRIHHAPNMADQNTNFGVIFPWWDRLFHTYAPGTSSPQTAGQTGLQELTGPATISLPFLLAQPFRKTAHTPLQPKNPSLIQIPH